MAGRVQEPVGYEQGYKPGDGSPAHYGDPPSLPRGAWRSGGASLDQPPSRVFSAYVLCRMLCPLYNVLRGMNYKCF